MTDGDVPRIIKDTGLKIVWMVVVLIKIGYTEGEAIWGNFIIILLQLSIIVIMMMIITNCLNLNCVAKTVLSALHILFNFLTTPHLK